MSQPVDRNPLGDRKPTRHIACAGCVLLALAMVSGCATRGYVRDRVSELRGEMTQEDARLQALSDQNSDLANRAMDRADAANQGIAAVQDLALGRVNYSEVSRTSIHFAYDSSELDGAAIQALDQMVALVRSHPEYVIDLYGFADPNGSEAYNFELGRRRAESVERYLVERTPGELSRYRTISFGELIPAGESTGLGTDEERRQALVMVLEKVPPSRAGPEELTSRE